MARITAALAGGDNILAFLDMLAWSELGAEMLNSSDDGYNLIVGSLPGRLNTFSNYAAHPNRLVYLPRYSIKSSAAGRYQFLYRTWMAIVRNYSFRGRFTPEAQDLAAIKILIECKALPHIQAGRIQEAIALAAPIWASLPGAGYGQREHKLSNLLQIYSEERAQDAVPEKNLVAMFTSCGGEVTA